MIVFTKGIKMKKITYVIHSLQLAGAERLVIDLIDRLYKKYDISIVSIYKSEDKVGEIKVKEKLENLGIKYKQINKEQGSSKYKTLFLFNKIIKDLNPDIIHAHTFMPNIYSGMRNLFFKKIPTITTIHTGGNDWYKKNAWIMERISFYGISKITTVSSYTESMYRKIMKLYDSKKIITVDNGIDIEKFPILQQEKLDLKRKELGLSKEDVLITNVARLVPNKGQDFLIDVIKHLDKRYKLLLVGNQENKNFYDNLVEKIDKVNVKDQVLILGSRNDINEILRLSNLFIFPSDYESSGISVLEAIYTNTSVLCTPLPTVKEFQKQYHNIELMEKNPLNWANFIKENINRSNRDNQLESFSHSLDRVAKNYMEIYEVAKAAK